MKKNKPFMVSKMNLPTWLEANERIVNGTYTPLDLFVVNNEPAGKEEEEKFRHELEALLEYVSGLTKREPDGGKSAKK